MYSRDSLYEYMKEGGNFKEMIVVLNKGIEFYEDFFGIEFPFSKIDLVFVPEFVSGAMENVGCVTFHESFIFKDFVSE